MWVAADTVCAAVSSTVWAAAGTVGSLTAIVIATIVVTAA